MELNPNLKALGFRHGIRESHEAILHQNFSALLDRRWDSPSLTDETEKNVLDLSGQLQQTFPSEFPGTRYHLIEHKGGYFFAKDYKVPAFKQKLARRELTASALIHAKRPDLVFEPVGLIEIGKGKGKRQILVSRFDPRFVNLYAHLTGGLNKSLTSRNETVRQNAQDGRNWIVQALGEAYGEVHGMGIQHGDAYPPNAMIRLNENGFPTELKLIDFQHASTQETWKRKGRKPTFEHGSETGQRSDFHRLVQKYSDIMGLPSADEIRLFLSQYYLSKLGRVPRNIASLAKRAAEGIEKEKRAKQERREEYLFE